MNRRRSTKERRQDNPLQPGTRPSRYPPSSTNDKRRFPVAPLQNGSTRPNIRPAPSTSKSFASNTTSALPAAAAAALPLPSSLSTTTAEQSSPRLSSHSSSSSLSSLVKRQSKPPPVVFLNKSADVELDGVSFGFDVDHPLSDPPASVSSHDKEHDTETNTLSSTSPTVSTQSNDYSKPSRRSQQRNNRGSSFYSGSDIRPQHQQQRHYASPPTPSYVDPFLLFQYNQQRLGPNYSQQLAYMNYLRAQYLSQQAQYVLVPTPNAAYPPAANGEFDPDEPLASDEPTSEQMQEPLLVYTTIPTPSGQIYFQPTVTMKKTYQDVEQPTAYPAQFFYSAAPNLIPSSAAYFQPIPSIPSPSLFIDTKSPLDNTDDEDAANEHHYGQPARLYQQQQQSSSSSSSHIMSNALKLVYSQEKRHAPTDRFNLEQLTVHFAMKWTDTVNQYEQGEFFVPPP